MLEPALFADLELPTGGTLREALTEQALVGVIASPVGVIEEIVDVAIEILEKEIKQ